MAISIAGVFNVAGNGEAQYILAKAYERGLGCAKNLDIAFEWYQQAAEAGYVKAKFCLATWNWNDKHPYKEVKNEDALLQDAAIGLLAEAKAGDRMSQAYLAAMFMHGAGVPRDLNESFKWLRESAEGGYDEAQYRLGIAYKDGIGTLVNETESKRWLKEAARQGNIKALAMIEGRDAIVDEIVEELKPTFGVNLFVKTR